MVTDKLKELEATRAKLATLEHSIAAQLNKELASLPAKYGFDSVDAFIHAVKSAGGGKRARAVGRPVGSGKKRRKRAVITNETRDSVKKMVGAGKTGVQIAKALAISLPSVQNIKKALGLVKKR